MIHFKTNLYKYNWNIDVFILQKFSEIKDIKNYLYKYDNYKQMLTRLSKFKNSGFSYSYPNNSILVVGLQDNLYELVDTFNHEKNHIETYIGNYYNIKYDSEEFSILSGNLAATLFKDLIVNLKSIFSFI